MLSKLYRQYPVKPDAPDSRDVIYSAPTPVPAGITSVDLRSFCGPVKDQGQTSMCTGCATTSMREFLYRKYFDQELDKTVPKDQLVLSPEYLYYREREFEGDTTQDAGASVRTAVKMINNVGTVLNNLDPINQSNLFVAPAPELTQEALKYKSGSYHKLITFDDMKSCIASGYGFVAGISVYESFEDDFTARTGIVLMPNIHKEKYYGGHCIFICGWDDNKHYFICQNSWGPESWGDKGFFYLPYQFVQNPDLFSDAWTCHLGKAWGTPQQIAEVIEKSDSVAVPIEHEPEGDPVEKK